MLEIAGKLGHAKETVRKLVQLATEGLLAGKQSKGCFMVNAGVEVAPHDKDVSKLVCKNDQQMEEIFFEVIQKGKQTGEIKNIRDARTLAKFFLNTVKGLQVTAKSNTDKSAFDEMISVALSTLD